MSRNPDWIDIPAFEFEIRGNDGSCLRFIARSVLAKRVAVTGVVGFDATLKLCTTESTFQHSFQLADYNGLRRFRDGLLAIRHGFANSVSLTGNGFNLTIGMHRAGVCEGLLIEGYCSSIHDLRSSPWPAGEAVGDFALLDRPSLGCLRFAFLSSLVDPPYVDKAIADIDAIRYLESEGFQP